jgi:hypothetical protein
MSGVPRRPEAPPIAATRARHMRAARGACWVIVAALAAAAALALLDAAVRLPGWVRGLALAAWVTGTGVLVWRLVVRPWNEEPEGGEPRAELSDNLRAAGAAAAALATCVLAGAFVPGAVDHLRRVALPWNRSAASPYRVVVTSGEPAAARGGSVTLTAYAEKGDAAAPTPAEAAFVFRGGPGQPEVRLPAVADGNATFHVTRPVPADFEYRAEIGGAASDWFAVTAIDPVELADGSITEILPPRYSPAAKSSRPGLAPVEGFAHAAAEFRLRFTRPADDAYLEFRAAGPPELFRVALSPDRTSGTATLRLKQDGALRLITFAERNGKRLRTEGTPVAVRVKADAPPWFESMSGLSPRPLALRPDAVLRVSFTAADDIAVGPAVLEWVAPGESRFSSVPITRRNLGGGKVAGTVEFPLAGKAVVGETVRFRLRVFDTRQLDDPPLKPQDTAYPASGWVAARVDADAPPPEVQEIVGRRDATRESLERAREEVRAADEQVTQVADGVSGKPALATDHVARLNNARGNVGEAVKLLRDAARECGLNPELRPLAVTVWGVIDGYLKDADEVLVRIATAPQADRGLALATASKHLADASDRIEELLAANDRVARDRLDAFALAALAADQESAANATAPPAERLARQQELLARFRALLAESAPLREASDAARRQEFDRLAASAVDLAGAVRDLNEAVNELHATARDRFFAAVTAEQKKLAAGAAGLLARVETAARLANATLPRAEDFRQASELVSEGKHVEALTELARLAAALEAVAATFDRWAADRADSKGAARQLALWQEDLRSRFRAATGGNAANFATLPAATRAKLAAEQAAIHAAAAKLRVPPDSVSLRGAALEHLTAADNFLKATGENADAAMRASAEQLNRLAEKLPAVPDRLAKSRGEFDRLYREQESILGAVEQIYRNSEPAAVPRKLPTLADRQQKQVAGFAALDLPGLGARRARTLAALAAAAADLRDGLAGDVTASQAWAKREFERFRTVLFENGPPPDDLADDLARRMRAVATAVAPVVAAHPEFPDRLWGLLKQAGAADLARAVRQLQPQAVAVQGIARQIESFPRVPEAPGLLNDAQEAVRVADMGFRNGTRLPELLRRVRAAADQLTLLSDRLNGAESDLDRVRRLAANRRAAAAEAKKLTPNSPANSEVGRQLGRGFEELTHTRVGAAGQVLKKRLLDEYARLRDHAAPDRQAGAHAKLATGLDELAALMADVEELGRTFDRNPTPDGTDEADAFLPSRSLADALRDFARRYRTTREQLTHLPEELAKWTRPAEANPLAAIEKRQRELAADVAKMVEALALRPAKFSAEAYQAAEETRTAAERFRNGSVPAGKEAAGQAADLLRKLAGGEPEAGKLADRQAAILAELAKLPESPAVAVAQQRARAAELGRAAAGLVRSLESASRDALPDENAAKTLADAADTARVAGMLLADGDEADAKGKPSEAATLRAEAEVQFRVAAAKAAGAGPALTTLPTLDPDTAAIGESLRRAELAMRQAARELEGKKPDPAAAGKSMRSAAEELAKTARGIRNRLTPVRR